MDSVSRHFAQPKKTIGWAYKALAQFDARALSFFEQEDPIGFLREFDPETGNKTIKAKLIKPLPDELEEFATNATLHAKNGFDQIITAASKAMDFKLTGNTYFPWASSIKDAATKLKNAGVPENLWDTVTRQEPYKTGDTGIFGNDNARILATVANNKHSVGLAVHATAQVMHRTQIRGAYSHLSIPSPRWDSVKNEAIIMVYNGDSDPQVDCDIAAYIVMTDPRFGGPVEAAPVMEAFINKADRACKAIETRCRQLLA